MKKRFIEEKFTFMWKYFSIYKVDYTLVSHESEMFHDT